MTIYGKESWFESVDDTFSQIKAYLLGAIGTEELHQVERNLFRQMQRLGRGFLEAFVAASGTGYEAGNPPLSEEGLPMEYKETVESPYVSIFGEITIPRAAYAHPKGGRVYPIDAQLNLPAHRYSYLLLKWMQSSSAEEDFRSTVNRFNEVFDFSFFPELPQRQGLPIAEYVEPFYEQQEAPLPETEGSHIAISADSKGVRILKREREEANEEVPAKPRRGKGEKPGTCLPSGRSRKRRWWSPTSPSIQKPVIRKRSSKACSTASPRKRKNSKSRIEKTVEKRAYLSLGCRLTSTSLPPSMARKPPACSRQAFDHLLDHVAKRDPQGQKRLVGLLDGDPYLEDRLLEELEARGMRDRLDALIVDIIHVSDYLWDVGTVLYGEKGPHRISWVEGKLYALLESKVGYVIGGLKQIRTKNRLSSPQKTAIQKAITYFENHRHMMDYATYLEKGYPIATGTVEGTCGSLVKDRMEQSGMRWSIVGAQAVLAQRAVVKNGDWEDFWSYFIDAERERLYPTVFERTALSKKAA